MRPTLRDLQIGDKFYPASQENKKRKIVYEVIGRPQFHNEYSLSLRRCKRVDTGEEIETVCFAEVIKLFYCLECGKKVGQEEKYCNECVIVE